MSRLIALGGKLRAGKDAAGDYLEEHHGFVKMGMSDPLNEALLRLDPWIPVPGGREDFSIHMRYSSLHDAVGYVEAKKNVEVRRLLQALGTEVGRDMISENVWVDIAEKNIRRHWAEGKDVVLTAIRFPNEVAMVERLGGLTVWIDRPEEARIDSKSLEYAGEVSRADNGDKSVRIDPTGVQEHSSENSVSAEDFDRVITNDGTLEELYEKVEKTIAEKRHPFEGREVFDDYGSWPVYDH